MTREAMVARLGAIIDELTALETVIGLAPGHGLCTAARLMLQLLVETLEGRAHDG